LYQLNQALAQDVLVVTSETISLDPQADVWLDVEVYQQLVEACLPDSHPADELAPECMARLREAVELYTDDFLAGFTP
jgi:hypothetical protein